MQPYMERAAQVACESQIAVQILLSRDNRDVELIGLKPQAEFISREEFAARKLRHVGVIGLSGLKPLVALEEPLEPRIADALAQAFLEYTRVLLGEHFAERFAEQMVGAEVAELERLYTLPDTRLN